MSSPSTPRTARSESPTGSPLLTPGRKIQAILAAFDSDSESDNGSVKQLSIPKPRELTRESDSEEDDDIVLPKGRLAARMQGLNQTSTGALNESTTGQTAFERVSKFLRAGREQPEETGAVPEEIGSSDEDDLPTVGLRRRNRNVRKAAELSNNDDDTPRESSRARSFSPLFMSSPAKQHDATPSNNGSDDDDDDGMQLKADPRVRALIMQKRKEREEKERLEAEKKAARMAQREQLSSEIAAADESDEDGSGRKLTQHRPAARKASKKALEEMNRETQRMSRNMQLAHQAQTKKKITKESFFARFNFMQPEESNAAENSSMTAGSQHSSDNEAQRGKETPQTSPVLGPSDKQASGELADEPDKEGEVEMRLEDFPSVEDLLARSRDQNQQLTVGRAEVKENATRQPLKATKPDRKILTQPPVRVRLSRQFVAQHQQEDSDDELEVVTDPAKCRRIAAFENLPAKKMQESASLLKLKALAHITSPTRRTKTMNSAELSATLLFQARQQAAKERQERIQELRAKGIIIETAEERAAMEDELENLVEKARQEAEEIAKKERVSEGKNGDEEDDDDDDFELSGSDDEGNGDGDGDEEEVDEKDEQGLIDSEAGEDEGSEDEQSEVMSLDEVDIPASRRKRPNRVISDDEDEDEVQAPKTPAKPTHSTVSSVERPQFPGLASDGLTMSLTQAFAGTLGASQPVTQQGSPMIPSTLPDPAQIASDQHDSDSQIIIKDSQEQRAESTDILAGYTLSESRVFESPVPRSISQFSQIPDPTQDAGFVLSPFDPSKRFLATPHSTIETVLVDYNADQNGSPVPNRRAKHLRRGRANLSVIQEQDEEGFEINASAFDVLKKAAKKTKTPFDWKTSKAKEIVEDAAEESDDEYAGLGGASDDSEDEEDAYDQQMINDNSGETVDEKQLAALNALHQRTADEKQVAKLMKDITTGALRRRRHGDDEFDLDDSDDELLARRRQKQREFARMRKALLADEKIGEIAENPKKAAFFRAIEDRDSDDDIALDFLDDEQNDGSQEDSSSQGVGPVAQQQPVAKEDNKRKRPLEPSAEDINNRPPPHLRRKPASAMSKKPATLAEIRETVSFLTERPEYDSFHEDASMDDADDADDNDGDSTPAPEQPKDVFSVPSHPRRTRGVVVDRLALLRQASSNSATASSNTRMAFFTSGGNDLSFRPPPLLRKTTTSSSSSTTSSKSDSSKRVAKAPTGGPMAKKGAVNYYTAAREREREREIRAKHRSSGSNIKALLDKHTTNRLGSLGGTGRWE